MQGSCWRSIEPTLTFLIQIPDWLESSGTKSRDALGTSASEPKPDDDSITEDSDNEQPILKDPASHAKASNTHSPAPVNVNGNKGDHSTLSPESSKEARKPTEKTIPSHSPPTKSPVARKAKRAVSSSSESGKSDEAVPGPSTRRGARQPIKRGGKRF